MAFLFPFGVLAQASPVGPESLRTEERLDQLERSVEELRAALAALRENPTVVEAPAIAVRAEVPAADFDELARRIDLLASELEALRLGEEVVAADRSEHGYGPAASKVYRSQPGVSLGGYGEFLFESFSSTRDDGSASGQRDLSDALRAIVYLGYKFDQNWLFNSEIEFEHAGSEVAVEFAYLDRLWRPAINFRGGHLLVPMGFVNELHEPPVFLGANRPQIERVILPSTWHENGFGVFGEKGNVTYRSYLMNGLDASGFSDSGLRGGRQKGAKALTEDIAWVSRVDYSPIPGFSLGGSLYVGDSGQGATDLEGRVLDVGTTIYEAHAEVRWRGLEARALAARATLDDVDRLDASLGLTGRSSIGDSLEGWYVQAGYDILARLDSAGRQLTPYFRWELFDTQASVPSGYSTNPANDREIFTLGLDYKPIAPIVLKLDYQDIDNEAGTGIDQFNLAVGYIF
ncbi:MAG: hypothetical protein K8J08_08130 [Thermoanaerobaculia bacterium]|nr:hypothetical protein [Thermoanaerobaculia bacterium]